jgi:hypothetical protein
LPSSFSLPPFPAAEGFRRLAAQIVSCDDENPVADFIRNIDYLQGSPGRGLPVAVAGISRTSKVITGAVRKNLPNLRFADPVFINMRLLRFGVNMEAYVHMTLGANAQSRR